MHKKYLLFAVVLVLALVGVLAYTTSKNTPKQKSQTAQNAAETTSAKELHSYLLAEFPKDIPLYQLEKISSSKFFVNDDTSADYLYGGPVNYFNVVFYTTAPRSEVFSFYTDLLDDIDTEESSESKLVGTFKDYTVMISQYDEDSEDVYMQVVLPKSEYQKENPFFSSYPTVIEIDPAWVEKESSYGLLNQNDGEVEYTQYFILDTEKLSEEADKDPFTYFFESYSEAYSQKPNFTADSENMMLTWNDAEYKVTLTFSDSHKRVYLVIRKPLQ